MKIAVFIDGGNLYRRLKEINIKSTSIFDYAGFVNFVANNNPPGYIGYYIGQIKYDEGDQKTMQLYANQQKLFKYLENSIPSIKIIRGHIQKFGKIYKEKGVDVKLALDIYRLANKDIYDKAIVISSDGDLVPAIELVQNENKKSVEYIGFRGKASFALMKECKSTRLLTYDNIKQFESKPDLS